MATQAQSGERERDYALIAPFFDREHYLRCNPDVEAAGIDPLEHFLAFGHDEGRDPRPDFSVTSYLLAYPDVRDAGVNAFVHYIAAGKAEGRRPCGAAPEASPIAEEFDEAFYRGLYTDLPEYADPLIHYLEVGWAEHRDPNPWFHTAWYLAQNPDVAASGMNPFLHYIVAGRAEGRMPHALVDLRIARISHVRRFEPQPAVPQDATPLASPTALAAELRAALRRYAGLIVSLGHDDYAENVGGVQLCIAREQREANRADLAYLNLHPQEALPCLAPPDSDPVVGIRLNGALIGAARTSRVVAGIAGAVADGCPTSLVVHSLLGHAPEMLAPLTRLKSLGERHFWIHDYLILCSNYTLLRNAINYCHAPPATSGACRICMFGAERREHLPRMEAFAEDAEFTYLAPSEVARSVVLGGTFDGSREVVVQPHCGFGAPRPVRPRTIAGPARIAFVGWPAPHKGYDLFQSIARSNAWSGDYEFHYFGTARDVPHYIRSHFVAVSADETQVMVDALVEAAIDIVVLWTYWPETFSLTAHEAIAAGCALITHADAGNVAALANDSALGVVLGDDAALRQAFGDGSVTSLAERARNERPAPRELVFSGLSVERIVARSRAPVWRAELALTADAG